MGAAASLGVVCTGLDVLERFIGNVEQASEIIALDSVFLSRGYFAVFR